ncbi:MAG: bifunctional hydroxymethylpyrimidine kinase/phosphomethylpyrimidine kinase [Bacteroidia bacterium]
MKKYQTVLSIAGSDSGGGAGIQADLKTFSALNCFGMTAITVLTAQNTQGVQGISPISPNFIVQQLSAIFEDIEVNAIKIGMLHDSEVIQTVTKQLQKYQAKHIVLDPVMVATSGDKLLQSSAINDLIHLLFPLAEIITPNIPEAEELLQEKISNVIEMKQAVAQLAKWGSKAVLLKGGHLQGKICTDVLYLSENQEIITFDSPKIATKNTHGTGCTLSAAIAAELAKGENVKNAVKNAHTYLYNAILAGSEYQLGKGNGPVWHFWEKN